MKASATDNRSPTLNNMGFMHLTLEPVVKRFLDHVVSPTSYIADIGAAYGYASLEILKRGGRALAIDLEQQHLDQLKRDCPPDLLPSLDFHCGHFPKTVTLPPQTFEGVLMLRVLLFLTPEEIKIALAKVYDSLKPGGEVCILTPSPFRKAWVALLPTYEHQQEAKMSWPGRIDNLWHLVPETRGILPNHIQLIDQNSLEQALKAAGFTLVESGYEIVKAFEENKGTHLTYAIARKE